MCVREEEEEEVERKGRNMGKKEEELRMDVGGSEGRCEEGREKKKTETK